jgi:serine/threonine protein kinase
MKQAGIILMIAATLFSPALQGWGNDPYKCSIYIPEFPEYQCDDEKPVGMGHSAVAFRIKKGEDLYILKVQELSPSSPDTINDLNMLKLLTPSIFIANLIDSKEKDDFLFEVIEFAQNGNLEEFMHLKDDEFGSSAKVLPMFLQLVDGLSYIHSKEIIHCDLKPENIVVTKDESLKIIDFDMAVAAGTVTYNRGTLKCMDPVLVENGYDRTSVYNPSRDVYSLGTILYYMTQKKYPFNAEYLEDMQKEHQKHKYTLCKGTSVTVAGIIDACLRLDENERKSLHDIRKMVFNAMRSPKNELISEDVTVENIGPNPYAAYVSTEEVPDGDRFPWSFEILLVLVLLVAGVSGIVLFRYINRDKNLDEASEPRVDEPIHENTNAVDLELKST